MREPLPLYDECHRCGSTNMRLPVDYADDAWQECFDWGEPVATWADYKQRAIAVAAKQLRQKAACRKAARR